MALSAGRLMGSFRRVKNMGVILQLIFSVVGILLLAKIVEPIWGSREFLLFITVVNVFSGLATLALVYIVYTVDLSGQLL